jgi:hypothetical protein
MHRYPCHDADVSDRPCPTHLCGRACSCTVLSQDCLSLLKHKGTPFSDTIRLLACRVLFGLAQDTEVAQVRGRLTTPPSPTPRRCV